ncbi:MAG: tRNA (adenosine(37)-N6)-dimethylallyltransferase MiaA [Candidatus Uhrbacteria bacterium]
MKSKIIVIVGPTASGKSDLSLKLAKKFNGEILCVDSRTVYRGMDVGTAKPFGGEEREGKGGKGREREVYLVEGVPHFGLDLINPDEEYNGALFKVYAEKVIADILSRGKLPILVGGTGLWLDMIIDNLESPEVEPDSVLRSELEKKTCEELFIEYLKLDPDGALAIDKKNKRRLIRALEVCQKTGRPFSVLRQKGAEKFEALWLGIEVEKNVLNERINRRVDEMIKNRLSAEVKRLKEKYGCEVYSMSGIGYQEFCHGFVRRGEWPFAPTDINEIAEEIKKNTRQYAKRQMTWFKRNKKINWVKDLGEAENLVKSFLGPHPRRRSGYSGQA